MIKDFFSVSLNFLLVFALGIFFSIVFTWPYILKLGTFYYDRGDYQLTGGALSYNEYSIRTGKIFDRETYFHGYQFYPQPYTLVYSDLRLIPSFVYAPIYWLTQNFVVSVNLTTFLTFVLSFVTCFYTISYFTGRKTAGIIGALIYTFNPLTFSRFPEHFELLNKYFLPLVFLFAYKYLTVPNIKNAFLFFLFLTLNAFSAVYFQIFSAVSLPIFAAPFLISYLRRKQFLHLIKIIKFCFVFLLFLPVFWYFDSAYLNFSNLEGSRRSLEENAYYSARLIDYVSSTPQSFLYGSFVKDIEMFRAPRESNSPYGNFNYQEHSLFLNIVPLLLFVFALIKIYGKFTKGLMEGKEKLLIFSSFLLLLVVFVLTLGPYFQGWNNQNGSFKLPFYYLYQQVSFFQGIRAPTRFLFIFYIPFSLFAAWGAAHFLQKRKSLFTVTVFCALLALLWLENYNTQPPNISYERTSAILQEIRSVKSQNVNLNFLEGKRTLHLPTYAPFNDIESIYLNWAAITHEKIVNGNRGSFLSSDQGVFLKQLDEKVDAETLKKLSILSVDYLIFHKSLLDQNLGKYAAWREVYQQGVILDNNLILVVDLSRYNFQARRCDFNTDLEIGLQLARLDNLEKPFRVVTLTNRSDCYLPAIYKEKYRKTDLYVNLLKQSVRIKMPILIEPYQTVIFSEIYDNLRWE